MSFPLCFFDICIDIPQHSDYKNRLSLVQSQLKIWNNIFPHRSALFLRKTALKILFRRFRKDVQYS